MSKNHSVELKIAAQSWYEETRSAYLYRIVAQYEKNPSYQKLFHGLAEEAEKQALIWAEQITKAGGQIPTFKPNLRARIVAQLIRRFGSKQVRTVLAAMKVRGMSIYQAPPAGHPMPKTIEDVGKRHQATLGSSNNLRAGVFGINDGLVSNASLIMGMAGASASNPVIILAGVAGLLAGAFSMAAGEYISVRSQREMFEYQITLEKKELELYPEEETEELALIYEARGLDKEDARSFARMMMRNPTQALDTLAREELGINPDELVSPYGAAIFSFISFTIGAAIPLLPFLFHDYHATLETAIGISLVALFIVGATMSLFTGRNAFFGGLRMMVIGAIAGAITFAIGHLIGVNVS